jgi:hypothetical protein
MTRKQLVKRFGAIGKRVPLNSKKRARRDGENDLDAEKQDPWGRADVWESGTRRRARSSGSSRGWTEVLDRKPDPLPAQDGFWPFPRPMVANSTTSKLRPAPDFVLAQDLYDEIDSVSTRITSSRARHQGRRGLRQATFSAPAAAARRGLRQRADPGRELGRASEKGGVAGRIAHAARGLVAALDKLREYRSELVRRSTRSPA